MAQSSYIIVAQRGMDGKGIARAVLPLLQDHLRWHTPMAVPKYHACCALHWLNSVPYRGKSLCERCFLTFCGCRNHHLPLVLDQEAVEKESWKVGVR